MNYEENFDDLEDQDTTEVDEPQRIYGKDVSQLLSLRSWMILVFAVLANEYVSTDLIYPRVREGRDAIANALKELRAFGLIKLSTTFVDGKWIRVNRVTTKGQDLILRNLKVVPQEGHFFPTAVDVMNPILTDEIRKEIRIAMNEMRMG
jgi:hypothetical protein